MNARKVIVERPILDEFVDKLTAKARSIKFHRRPRELAHLPRFGPVLVVQPVDGIEEAIRVANDHSYGLSAGVLTSDPDARRGPSLSRPARTRCG